ncbi:U1 small nuclear ribonucleoprotein C [Apiospora arundinis]|uniref:U1 small nuclear ribonucleoprotein C n=1 Tax=Apiospora arundinis TaxID=335852 RepID=A0ABR2IHL3_9PEZI
MKLTKVILGLQCITGVLGYHRYVIDRTSCTGDQYTAVKSYMDNLQAWATDICDVLGPYVQPPNTPPGDRIMQLATRIFGANDVDTMLNVYTRFDAIRSYVYTDVDNRSAQWKSQRDSVDVDIFCSPNHIIYKDGSNDPSVQYWDTTRDSWINNNDILLGLFDPEVPDIAITASAVPDGNQESFPENWSEQIVFHPDHLQLAIAKGYAFGQDRIEKALDATLFARIQRRNARKGKNVAQVDTINGMESTMLHEARKFLSSISPNPPQIILHLKWT